MKKFAGVYKRKNLLYMRSNSRTTDWIVIGTGPVIVEPHEVPPDVLGRHILELLKKSEWDIPPPPDPNSVIKPLLEAAGVKSWSAFQRGALYCGIILDEKGLEIRPYENNGRGGFVPLPESEIISIPPTSSPREIGEALLKAISKSR